MLDNKNKKKIEEYIDKLIKEIYLDVQKYMAQGVRGKQLIDKTINLTVNKLTPESKMILSSTYNMLMKDTFSKDLFKDVQNKSAFYELDIFKDLNSKFIFDIPKNINYEDSEIIINKWVASGTVTIIGGLISIPTKSFIPVGIAIILAGIMAILLKDDIKFNSGKSSNDDVDLLIKEYLKNIKESLILWIRSIEKYYDDKLGELERELVM